MAAWLLKKGTDGTKRLARTLAPPKTAIKIDETMFSTEQVQGSGFCRMGL
jgi:hypothetical protein